MINDASTSPLPDLADTNTASTASLTDLAETNVTYKVSIDPEPVKIANSTRKSVKRGASTKEVIGC